jgi:hypothetical protein
MGVSLRYILAISPKVLIRASAKLGLAGFETEAGVTRRLPGKTATGFAVHLGAAVRNRRERGWEGEREGGKEGGRKEGKGGEIKEGKGREGRGEREREQGREEGRKEGGVCERERERGREREGEKETCQHILGAN